MIPTHYRIKINYTQGQKDHHQHLIKQELHEVLNIHVCKFTLFFKNSILNICLLAYHRDNDNDHQNKRQSVRINSLQKSSSSNSSTPTDTAHLPQVKSPVTHSNTQSKRRTSEDERSTPIITGQNGRCSQCPHCNRLPQTTVKKSPIQQPAWIVEAPRTDQRHIIMDNYDEIAVRKKLIAEHGHIPGCYDYSPNLTIEEEKNHNQTSNKYSTLPLVTKSGSPTTPSRTPFPNYDALQRREKRLNQPYTTTLFTD
jgi:hypothetical protein